MLFISKWVKKCEVDFYENMQIIFEYMQFLLCASKGQSIRGSACFVNVLIFTCNPFWSEHFDFNFVLDSILPQVRPNVNVTW